MFLGIAAIINAGDKPRKQSSTDILAKSLIDGYEYLCRLVRELSLKAK